MRDLIVHNGSLLNVGIAVCLDMQLRYVGRKEGWTGEGYYPGTKQRTCA